MVAVVSVGAFVRGLIWWAKRNSIRSDGASGDTTWHETLRWGGRAHPSSGMWP